jgi:hypothetical protein
MNEHILERDWKVLRDLKPVLLDRLCTRIMEECRRVMDDDAMTPHQRYLKLFETIHDRNEELADAFDDMRRSRAVARLSNMYMLDLFTPDELARFSPETRDSFIGTAEIHRAYLERKRGRR